MNKESNYIYLSYFLDSNTPLYGGGKGVNIVSEKSISKGDTANTSFISFNNHSGTHIDFPKHFFESGKSSDSYLAKDWVFKNPFMLTLNVHENEIINLTDNDFCIVPQNIDFLILKTGFGNFRGEEKYWKNNPGLSPELATSLRKKFPFLRVVGMDFISLTSYQNRELGRIAHRSFLGGENPILLIEDMDLSQLYKTPLSIICLPFMARNIDGAPISIIAEQNQ